MTLSDDRAFTRSYGDALTQYGWCPQKEERELPGKCTHRGKNDHFRTQQECNHLQAKGKNFNNNQTAYTLISDF